MNCRMFKIKKTKAIFRRQRCEEFSTHSDILYLVNIYISGVDFVTKMAGLSENIILIYQTIRSHIGTVMMTPAIKLDITVYGCALNLCASGQRKVSGSCGKNNGRLFIIKGRPIT